MSTKTNTTACGHGAVQQNDPVYIESVQAHGIVKQIDYDEGVATVAIADESSSTRSRREVPIFALTASNLASRKPTDSDKANLKAELYL